MEEAARCQNCFVLLSERNTSPNGRRCLACVDVANQRRVAHQRDRRRDARHDLWRSVVAKYGGRCADCGTRELWVLTVKQPGDAALDRPSPRLQRALAEAPRKDTASLLCFNCLALRSVA